MKKIVLSLALVATVAFVSCKDTAKEPEVDVTVETPAIEETPAVEVNVETPAVEETPVVEGAAVEGTEVAPATEVAPVK